MAAEISRGFGTPRMVELEELNEPSGIWDGEGFRACQARCGFGLGNTLQLLKEDVEGALVGILSTIGECSSKEWSCLRGARRKARSWEQWKITWKNDPISKVDIEALERLIEPEDEEVCLRCILKYSTRGGSNIIQLFGTEEKTGPFRGQQKALVRASRRKGSRARKLAK